MSPQTFLAILIVGAAILSFVLGRIALSIFKMMTNRQKVKGKVFGIFLNNTHIADMGLVPEDKQVVHRSADDTNYQLLPRGMQMVRYPIDAPTTEQVLIPSYIFVANYSFPFDPFVIVKENYPTGTLLRQSQDEKFVEALIKIIAQSHGQKDGLMALLPLILTGVACLGVLVVGILSYQTGKKVDAVATLQMQQMENPLNVPTPIVPRR